MGKVKVDTRYYIGTRFHEVPAQNISCDEECTIKHSEEKNLIYLSVLLEEEGEFDTIYQNCKKINDLLDENPEW